MPSSVPARFEDTRFDREHVALAAFLAAYRDPTRSTYRIAMNQWFDWCHLHGLSPLDAERAHIEVWARELEERKGLMRSTIASKLNTLGQFYKMCMVDKLIVDNPSEWVRRPSVPRVSTTKGLTRNELMKCLELAEASTNRVDHALWCFLAYNGPRIGEVCALNVEDLGRQGGYRTVMLKREKGNRSAEVPLAPRTSWAFDRMLGSRTTGPLFTMRYGERMDRKAANRIIKRIVKLAGINKKITPHSLRHTHITLALNAGVTVRNLTNSMGYADSRQITYYDRDKESLERNATHMVSAYVES